MTRSASPLRHATRLTLAVACVTASFAAPPFAKIPRGDHSLCCGIKVPLDPDGVPLDFSDPAYAEVLARQQAHARAAAATEKPSVPSSAPSENPKSKIENLPPTRPLLRLPGPPLSALDGPLTTRSGYAEIAFSQLAGFPFSAPTEPLPAGTPAPDLLAQIPASVRRLDGKKVVLTGFMLPTKMENGFATEFLFLSSSQLCCYGTTPAANEWMLVKMKKEGLPAVQDVPMTLAGRLRVQPRWTDGFLTSLYELEGDGLLKTKS
jgi:hypothetical protein